MDERARKLRVRLLLAAHVVVGMILGGIPAFTAREWPTVAELGYIGFFASEILLLGTWVGLDTSSRWSTRLCIMIVGIAWLSLIFLVALHSPDYLQELPDVVLLVSLSTIGVSGSTKLLRKSVAHVELRTEWPQHSIARDLQFNMKSLLWLTALVGILLGIGGTVRRLGGDDLGVVVLGCVFALEAMFVAWLLAYAGLGRGHNSIRVPLMLAGVAVLGLLPPYCFGRNWTTFLEWESLLATVAFCTLMSLIVIRSCGYRLVRLAIAHDHNVAQISQRSEQNQELGQD